MPAPNVVFRVAYVRYAELRDDIAQQMVRGGLLVKVQDALGLTLDSPVELELVLPDGTALQGSGTVIQIFAGLGVAVSVDPLLVERASQCASRPEVAAAGAARHEWIDRVVARRGTPTRPPGTTPPPVRTAMPTDPPVARSRPPSSPPPLSPRPSSPSALPLAPVPTATVPTPRSRPPSPPPPFSSVPAPPPHGTWPTTPMPIALGSNGPAKPDSVTRNEKIQKALHGTRDERNAILRDRDRTLHTFVLRNPQLDAEDVLSIAKNAQMAPDLLKQIGERKDWFQRPAIALALARNPKTPPEVAVRALDHVSLDALRQMAKGGVLPHVAQAARKKLLG